MKVQAFSFMLAAALTAQSAGGTVCAREEESLSDGLIAWLTVQSYNDACSENGGTEGLWETEIEGEETEVWIRNRLQKKLREYLALEQKFDEAQLSLRASEKESISSTATRYWQELGYGRYYADYGIEMEDFTEVLTHEMKNSVLYGEMEGELENAVTEEEIAAYIEENGTLLQYIAVPHSSDGSEESVQADECYASYQERLEAGEALEDLVKEVAEDETLLEVGISSSYTDGVEEQLFLADTTSLSSGFKEAMAAAAEDEIVYFDDTAQIYQIIFCKKDFTSDWDGLELYRDSITERLAGQQFDSLCEQWGEQTDLSELEADLPSAQEIREMFCSD